MTKFAGTSFTRESDGADAFEGGGAGGTTNLSILNRGATTLDIASSSGADATVPAATTSLTGLLSAADKTKLDGLSGTNLTYTASTRALDSSTGTGFTFPLFTSTEAGLTPLSGGGTTNFLRADGSWAAPPGGGGGVTSVGGTGTVSGLTLTGTVTSTGNLTLGGTLAVTASNFASQTANFALIAPNGSAGVPTFRALVAADIPTLNQNTTGSAATLTTSRNFSITGGGITASAVGFNGSAAVALSASVDAAHITLARMANLAANSFIGNNTGSAATPIAMTGTQATALLDNFTTSLKGLAPASGGGTTNFLRADGTWAAPSGGTGTNISYTASTRAVASSTGTGFTFPLLTSTEAGLAPLSGGGTTNFLRADGTWAAPAGGGGGTGKQTIYIPASAMTPRITNGPSVGSLETTTNRVNVVTLDFDPTTQEFAQFQIAMPKSWDEGTVTFDVVWYHPSTTTNFGVVWSMAGVALSDTNALDTAFGTAVQVTDTGGTTNTLYDSPESGAVTIGNTPAENDYVVFQVARVPADASDTMAVDARLLGVRLFYTTNAGNDA